jgi:hypothetical protein
MSAQQAGLPVTTTPTQPPPHGIAPRGLATTPSSPTTRGRFGRMFRHVPVYAHDAQSLIDLGTAMVQDLEPEGLDKPLGTEDDNENTSMLGGELRLPAGYTYFGQFVDHDITFDPVSSLTRQSDPDGLENFRTPRFDLDSLYGRGPSDEPFLYAEDNLHLALGKTVAQDPSFGGPDLQRTEAGRAIIGDPRNDENLIVSQLQVSFIKFHNRVVEQVAQDHPALGPTDQFKLAQKEVRWHYQWVVIHDYLRRLVGEEVVEDILCSERYRVPGGPKGHYASDRRRFYQWRREPFMPVEFAAAAYRFGHSMVRPSYAINDAIPLPVIDGAARIPVFSQTGGPLQHLNGFRTLPDFWGIQWKYFLPRIGDAAGDNDEFLPQPSYRLDTQLANPLGALPKSVAGPESLLAGQSETLAQSLAVRNLLRGQRLSLPCGQDVARAMGISPMSDEDAFGDLELPDGARRDLAGQMPLWYYVLREAEVYTRGAHLGPVGGRIVAEVLIGLLAGDPLSYLRVQPTWTPTLESRTPATFTLSDLIRLAVREPVPAGGNGRGGLPGS